MEKEGLAVNGKAPHGSQARGETGAVQQGGGRFVTLACGTDVFHNVPTAGRRPSIWPTWLATLERWPTEYLNWHKRDDDGRSPDR